MNNYCLYSLLDKSFLLKIGDNSQKIISSKKSYEPHLTYLFNFFVGENDNVIDLGANIGYHTVTLSKLAKNGQVFAAEPLKEVYYNLCSNLLLNGCMNVKALNKVCTDKKSKFVMEKIDWGNSGNCKIEKEASSLDDLSVAVDSFILDDIDIPTTLIKMDVQGSECNVILGGDKHLSAFRPIVIVEIEEHHLNAFGKTSKDLLNMFVERDYVLYRIMNEYPCDHVAIPKEKDTFDIKAIVGYDVVKIDKLVKETTMRWPLYEKAIY